MDENIYIGLFCLDFEEAKKFYITNLGFKIKYDLDELTIQENSRAILVHTIVKNLEVEFMTPQNNEETSRVGMSGGSMNLFTIPTKNIDLIKEKLENTKFFLNYSEPPNASFRKLKDPMGNIIYLYERT